MQHVHPIRLIRAPLPLALLVSGILIAGCGGSSDSVSTVAAAGGAARTDTSTTTGGGATTSPPDAPANTNQTALAFSRCMRANGVPSFPDPSPGGGFLFNANGVDRSSPAFKEAQVKCSKLLAGSGPPLPGTQTHPTAQTLAKLLKVAQCMRQHGVPDYPDPRTSVPADPFPSGGGVITDYDGAILLFPSTIGMNSPAFTQAAAACGTLAGKLGRGPHS